MLVRALGYVGVASPDAKEWLEFGPEVLGMEAVEAAGGSVLLRIDDADHRLAVHHGERNRMLYAGGWDVAARMRLPLPGGRCCRSRVLGSRWELRRLARHGGGVGGVAGSC